MLLKERLKLMITWAAVSIILTTVRGNVIIVTGSKNEGEVEVEMSATIDWPSYKRGEHGTRVDRAACSRKGQERVSLGISSREQVTCYSTSPTRIPDYRRQHHRSDGLRSFFKRFSTSLRRRLAHATSRDCSPVSATTAAIPENRLVRREWERVVNQGS